MNSKMSHAQIEGLYKGYCAEQEKRNWIAERSSSKDSVRTNVLCKLVSDGYVVCTVAKYTWSEPYVLTDAGRVKAVELGFEARYRDEKLQADAKQLSHELQQKQYRDMLGLTDNWTHWLIQISRYIGGAGVWDIKTTYGRLYGRIDRSTDDVSYLIIFDNYGEKALTTPDDLDTFQREFNRMRELLMELQAGMHKVPEGEIQS